MDVEDRELIERCRAGDDTAFGELVDRYKDLVFGLIYRMVADRSLAEDLAQDVFLKVHRGIPYFRGEARLSTWIFRIVQNVCVQARSRRPADEPLEGTPRPDAPVREFGTEDRAFGAVETRDRLTKALVAAARELPHARRRALPARRAVRRAGRSPQPPARDGEDSPVSGEATAP